MRGFLLDSRRDAASSRPSWYLKGSTEKRSTLPTETLTEVISQEFKSQFREKVVLKENKDSFGNALARLSASGVLLAVEVGAAKSYLGVASFGRVETVVAKSVGVGGGVDELFSHTDVEKVLNWLSRERLSPKELCNYWGTKGLYPQVLPPNKQYQHAELALAREILILLGQEAASSVTISSRQRFTPQLILSGSVLAGDSTGAALHALLDGLNLSGIWNVWLDRQNILQSLGATAEGALPKEELGFKNLGTVMILEHRREKGTYLGNLSLDLGLEEQQEIELISGEILRVPFNEKTSGKMELEVLPSVKLAGDAEARLVGGSLGIIVDARSRPLPRSYNQHWEEVFK